MKEKIKSNKGFYIGDICYVLDERVYQEIWGNVHGFTNGKFTDPQTNMSFAVADTRYGDGEYSDNKGRLYGVDAGVIGLVPAELIRFDYDFGGQIFDGAGEATFEAYNGVFFITLPSGEVVKIDTTDEDDDMFD